MKRIRMGDRLPVSKGDKFILVIGDAEVPVVYAEGGSCFECPLFGSDTPCSLWIHCKIDRPSSVPFAHICHVRTLEDLVE